MTSLTRCARHCTVALSLIAAGAGSARALELARDGRALATILLPNSPDERTRTAAGWLKDYLARATGATLPIAMEPAAPDGSIVAVGHTQRARQAGIGTEGLRWDGCRLTVRGRALFLLGRDEPPLGHAGAHGTGRAVVTFLEDVLGVRWFLPGPMGDHVPEHKHVAVPDDLDRRVSPLFAYVHGRHLYGRNTPGSIANNFRTAVKVRSYGGHSYYSWLPYKTHFDAHPEYFAVMRSARYGVRNDLCSSNPEVKRILLTQLRKAFDAGHDWVQLGQEDGYRRCECAQCDSLDRYRGRHVLGHAPREEYVFNILRENPCERLLLLHKWIADRCLESHPDKTVHLLVYGPTTMPSKLFDRFGPNVVGELCSEDPRILALWRGRVRALTEYVYWWYPLKGIRPMFTPQQVAEHVRALHASNVIGVYQTAEMNWGLEGPNYYAMGRLFGQPDLDPDALVREYCQGVYPEVAERMKGFFDLLYSRVKHSEDLDQVLGGLGGSMQETRFLTLYPPGVVGQLDHMLKLAQSCATAPRTKGWIKHTRDHFDYVKQLSLLFASYRAYLAQPGPGNFAELRSRVDAFEQWRERVLGYDAGYVRTWFPGYHVAYRFLTHQGGRISYYDRRPRSEVAKGVRGEAIGFGRSAIRAPLTWDFETMAKRIGQRVGRPLLVAKETDRPPRIDGRIEPAKWRGAAGVDLGTVGGAAAGAARTRVRLLYDRQCLYVGWECAEPKIDRLQLEPVGRDGAVYSLDCVELLLDPSGSMDSYRHFMAAPTAGARYDARVDRVLADPHQSIHSPEDRTYDPEWRWAFVVDRPGARWSIEMALPFRSLDTEPPRPGDGWLGNFGRERYVGARAPDLYLWSPSRTGSFRDVFAFGAVYFGRGPRDASRPGIRPKPESLLPNGSFEERLTDEPKLPARWRMASYPGTAPQAPVLQGCRLTEDKAAEGKLSLLIDPHGMDLAALESVPDCHALWGQNLTRLLPKLKGQRVRLSAKVYFDARADMPHPNPFFVLRARTLKDHIRDNVPAINVTSEYLAAAGYTSPRDQLGQWLELSSEGVVPAETTALDLHCGMRGKVKGRVNETRLYVDNVRLTLIQH